MSWMDSWSRPSANSKVPAPLYLSGQHVSYCHTCGRVMNSKKATKKQKNPIKYCSDKCRSRKPGAQDRKIERTIVALLQDEPDSGIEKTAAKSKVVKGDTRLVVTCDEIEEVFFGSRFDPEKVYGRRKNRKKRWIGDPDAQWMSVDMEDSKSEVSGEDHESESEDDDGDDSGSVPSTDGGVRIRPPQDQSEVNFSVGGERGKAEKIEESADDLEKRRQGARRAEEREMVRRAARRGIVFGFEVPRRETAGTKSKTKAKGRGKDNDDGVEVSQMEVRKAEALMNGTVVEPSYAKGNWAIRWRE
ncbi:hypothetical protein M409DRAFT_16751 [Zasmidium cellare ATCC 36951]|uniref:Uncharacterized protein n=1 Tax=Zasmidium cellare ATCC 36951 TaxID=1080233 RepID=A0A6A6D328_ZASCE|nr:uncharacterized protein M409DRAFT_16751 [Zasmidium cellare ATCC 36951]KAF2172790.1 hypothetical protein M409DRAFT_16751 [Zasmidium cellare ATCC 36951]